MDLSHFHSRPFHDREKTLSEWNTMGQNGTDYSEDTAGLTESQLAALPYLGASPAMAERARLAEIDRTTFYRWVNDHIFRTALERLRAEAADLAHGQLWDRP